MDRRLSYLRNGWRMLATLGLVALALPLPAAFGQVRIQGEAVVGRPFGVGRLSIELPAAAQPEPLGVTGLGLAEKQGRILYPAVDQRPFRTLLRDLLGAGSQRATIYFLFRGDKPLEVTLNSATVHSFVLTPRDDPRTRDRLLGAWWLAYAPPPRLLAQAPDYPPMLENYLRPMLGTRLGLIVPPARALRTWQQRLDKEVGLMLGTESIRVALQRDRLLGRLPLDQSADRPLPRPIDPPPLALPELTEKVQIEPIALRAPHECLYLRFGNVSNFLWFRRQLNRWGGDLSNLLFQRGLDYEPIAHTEAQLALRQADISKMLGDAVSGLLGGAAVADVAIIGTDTFQREGAALGVLFQARLNAPLAAEIRRQRAEAVRTVPGAEDETVEVAGRKVSFLSAPHGAIRSFYVVDGNYHLVTTSKTLVRRFLETASGAGSLGASEEFRHARARMPLARDDTMFVYLSDAFFRNLTSPQYRVEMTRRMQARVDAELVGMAILAAVAEGHSVGAIGPLVANGFLPKGFGPRPDGSRTEYVRGQVFDSLRGRVGSFVPIPDVEVTAVTPAEAEAYERFAEHYRTEWGRIDPTAIALKRHPLPNHRERVVIDAQVSPLNRQVYGLLADHVGPADRRRLAAMPADVVSAQVILRDQRLFFGIQDVNTPAIEIGPGRIAITIDGSTLASPMKPLVVGYVGTHGPVGLLGMLDVLVLGQPDAAGYAGMEPGVSRRHFGQFTVYSYQRKTLAEVTEQLKFEEAVRPAQVWAQVGDISQGRLSPMVNAWGYSRTRRTSLGNLRLLHALNQQLHLPAADGRSAAEMLLGAKLVCPLRGSYVYRENRQGQKRWTSTALGAIAGVPEGYQAPPLNWFRGMSLVAQLEPAEMSVHAEVQMELPPPE